MRTASTARCFPRSARAPSAASSCSRLTHREAERHLISSSVALRAADALHLAMALGAGAATVLTYDRAMAGAAIARGLAVWPEPAP